MKDVIKTTVFLNDMNNFGAMNEGILSSSARATIRPVRLLKLAPAKDALVEIEGVAVAP